MTFSLILSLPTELLVHACAHHISAPGMVALQQCNRHIRAVTSEAEDVIWSTHMTRFFGPLSMVAPTEEDKCKGFSALELFRALYAPVEVEQRQPYRQPLNPPFRCWVRGRAVEFNRVQAAVTVCLEHCRLGCVVHPSELRRASERGADDRTTTVGPVMLHVDDEVEVDVEFHRNHEMVHALAPGKIVRVDWIGKSCIDDYEPQHPDLSQLKVYVQFDAIPNRDMWLEMSSPRLRPSRGRGGWEALVARAPRGPSSSSTMTGSRSALDQRQRGHAGSSSEGS
jgi:hypothetical protein